MAQFLDSPDASRLFTLDSLLTPPDQMCEWLKTNPQIGTPVGEVRWPSVAELERAIAPPAQFPEWNRRHVAVIAHAFALPRYMLAQAIGLRVRRARGYRRHIRRIKAKDRRARVQDAIIAS